jgi:hypothetical protein
MRSLPRNWCRMIKLGNPWRLVFFVVVAVAYVPALAQPLIRSVSGTVVDRQGQPLPRAVVQIEDLTSLQIRSFVTQGDGSYYFFDLSGDRDYKLSARYRRVWGRSRTLSAFDSRKLAIVNLKVDVKKEE